MMTTTVNLIRKNANGSYQFLTSAFPSYCVMTQGQFETLIGELEKLKLAPSFARDLPIARFPDFEGLYKTTRIDIRKDFDGYLLASNMHGDFLCRMNESQFDQLIKELIELRDLVSCAAKMPEVYFPDFTYEVTG